MSGEPRVLIVEDEPKIAKLLEDYLRQASFDTHWLAEGTHAVDWVRDEAPDVVLLDLMLPGKDGLSICQEVRRFSSIPIIMITARIDEIDRLLGLELGADDYVCKPFSPREVVARVKAVHRRASLTGQEAAGQSGIRIDEDRFEASLDGESLDLTPVEFRMLALFAAQPGRVFSRDRLIDSIYTDGRVVSDRTVDSHVKNLRKKLAAITGDDGPIRSIYGVGYKLD